jgi:hypothetical protein
VPPLERRRDPSTCSRRLRCICNRHGGKVLRGLARATRQRQECMETVFLIAAGLGCILLSHSWWPAVFGLMLAGTGVANIVPVIWSVAGRDTRMGACSSTSVGSFVRARFQTGGVFFAVIHAFGVVGDHPGWKKT